MFKVGDVVEVITEFELKEIATRKDNDGNYFLGDGFKFVADMKDKKPMSSLYGKQVKIKEVYKIYDGTYRYRVEGNDYRFTDSILFRPNDKERLENYKKILITNKSLCLFNLEYIDNELNRISELLDGE